MATVGYVAVNDTNAIYIAPRSKGDLDNLQRKFADFGVVAAVMREGLDQGLVPQALGRHITRGVPVLRIDPKGQSHVSATDLARLKPGPLPVEPLDGATVDSVLARIRPGQAIKSYVQPTAISH